MQAVGVAGDVRVRVRRVLRVFFAIKQTIGLRVDEDEEAPGLDISSHGMYGYPESFIPPEEYPGGPDSVGVPPQTAKPTPVGATAMTSDQPASRPTL